MKVNTVYPSKKSGQQSGETRKHYEVWPFPDEDFLSREGLLFLRNFEQWLREKRAEEEEPPRVIDIGCGTGNTTIALAKNFPDAQFLGADISTSSLKIARLQAKRRKVDNVTFQNLDLMRHDFSRAGKFKVVLCTGVLHHIENMHQGFRQIVQLIEKQGYLVLWLYGRYGRMKHNLNQSFIKLLTENSSKSRTLSVAKAFLENLGLQFAKGSGFYSPKGSGEKGICWLLKHPQWIVDQMIPAFEQSVTMKEILEMFNQNYLEFTKWLGVPPHLKSYTSSKILLECFEKLSFQERLLAIDYLLKPEYYFVAGKKLTP
jgi:2-polyprenyl-3-methyl-5-hydroxy-6-metoxy-1,4-benzoquinol methylase